MDYSKLPNFSFNGVKSYSLGIVVKEMPPIIKAEKNIETIVVSGRNGAFHIDEGTYKTKNYSIACILMDITKIEEIKSLFDGRGILELSTEPNKTYNATIKNQIDFSKYLTYLKEFPLQFELDPIAYSKEVIVKEFSENSAFTAKGTIKVSPIITVEGTGTVTLNNVPFEVLESDITIDCDLMNCTRNGLNMNNKVNLEEFPSILPGNNTIVLSEGITTVILSYKEGWI